MALTKEREEKLRAIHTDNRYGVLELLEEIGRLKEEIEGADGLNSYRHRVTMYFTMLDKVEKEREALRIELDSYNKIMSKLIDHCNDLEKERDELKEVVKSAKELRDSKWGREYKKVMEKFDKLYEKLETK